MPSSAPTLDYFVRTARDLYSLPAVAVEVLELTSHPRVDTRALKSAIEKDPALTTKVLRVVNSSLFGLSREVRDLNQALALLGIKPLKLLVLGFSLPPTLFRGLEARVLGRYWQRTLTKAVAARELCETLWRQPGDEAFIAGLLHDVGLLALAQQLGESYTRFVDRAESEGLDLAPLEQSALGFAHTELSAALLAHWKLAPPLVEGVRLASRGDTSPDADPAVRLLVSVLRQADCLAHVVLDGAPDRAKRLLDDPVAPAPLTAERLEALAGGLEAKVRQLAEVLSLELPEGQDRGAVLARAHAALADVAEEAALELLGQTRSLADETHQEWEETRRLAERVAAEQHRALRKSGPPPARSSVETNGAADHPPLQAPRRSGWPGAAPDRPADYDPAILGHLAAAAGVCRQQRTPLSVLLVEIDGYEDLVFCCGPDAAARLARHVEELCETSDLPGACCLPAGEARFAVILPRCDRDQAVELGDELVHGTQRGAWMHEPTPVTLSVGVATAPVVPRNFAADQLLEAAERCLATARRTGGNSLKSIGVY
jgi:HD-like signal output (HDOD) protein/GGDEF domain-containing protein